MQMTLAAQLDQKQQGTRDKKVHYEKTVKFTKKFSSDGKQDFSKFLREFDNAMITIHPNQRWLHFLKAIGETEREALLAAEAEYTSKCSASQFTMEQISDFMRKTYRLRFEKVEHTV
jgi:hypothetical protein